jgi:hypothetical protein
MPVFGNDGKEEKTTKVVSFDLSQVGAVAPAGDYPLVVRSATVRRSGAGNLYILVTSLINDPDSDYHGIAVRTNIMLEADAMVPEITAAGFMACLGFIPPAGEYDTDDWKEIASQMVGNEFWASLKVGTWNDKERNEVARFIL